MHLIEPSYGTLHEWPVYKAGSLCLCWPRHYKNHDNPYVTLSALQRLLECSLQAYLYTMSDPKTVDTESAGLLYNPDNEHEDECCSHCGRAYKPLSHQKERSKATWIIIWILLCALLINIGGLLLQLHRVPSGVQKDPSLQLYCKPSPSQRCCVCSSA